MRQGGDGPLASVDSTAVAAKLKIKRHKHQHKNKKMPSEGQALPPPSLESILHLRMLPSPFQSCFNLRAIFSRGLPLGEMAYLQVDALYEKLGEGGLVIDEAVLQAIGINI